LPPSSLLASCRPSRDCWPSTAAGPDRVVITPILIFSCAAAGVAATPSTTASPVSFNDCFMIIPPFGLCSRTHTTANAQVTAYSDGDGTCKHNASMQAMRQLLET